MNTNLELSHERASSWKRRLRSWLPGLSAIYCCLAAGYIFYSDATDTGLMGHLFAFEVHTFGIANMVINLLLAMVVVPFFPPFLLARVVGHGLPAYASGRHGGTILKIVAALLALALAASVIHTRNLKVYDVDLGLQTRTSPPRSGYLVLQAIPASRFQSSYFTTYLRGGNRINTYQPLVDPGWSPDQPIHYFLFETRSERSFASTWRGRTPAMEVSSARANFAGDFDRSQLAAFRGHVVGPLPTIVIQDFIAKGFAVASDYVVIKRIRIRDHEVAVFDRYENFLIPALIIVGIPMMMVVGGVFIWLAGTVWRYLRPNRRRPLPDRPLPDTEP